MAQYRFHAAIVRRSLGQSVVAAAAYRAGEKLHDERTGEIKDFARRSWSVLYTQILTPENAPAWMRDRQRLWNGVEHREDRSTKPGTAQLARNIELSLPYELTHEQHVELVCEFVKAEFVDRGMVADIAIHAPPYRGDGTNHHAHILLTMRDIEEGVFGNKNRAWNEDELLEHWRERWADYQNRALAKCGFEARVDHRTLEAQGIDREPTMHLGPTAQTLEDQGIRTDRGDQNRRIKSNNDNLALAKQDLADSEKRLAALRRLYAAEQMEQIQKIVRVVDAAYGNAGQYQAPAPDRPPEPERPAPAKQPETRAATWRWPGISAAERIEQAQKIARAVDAAREKAPAPDRPPEPEPPPQSPTTERAPEPAPPAPAKPPELLAPTPRGRRPSHYAAIDRQKYAERAEAEQKQGSDREREKEEQERERKPDRDR